MKGFSKFPSCPAAPRGDLLIAVEKTGEPPVLLNNTKHILWVCSGKVTCQGGVEGLSSLCHLQVAPGQQQLAPRDLEVPRVQQ